MVFVTNIVAAAVVLHFIHVVNETEIQFTCHRSVGRFGGAKVQASLFEL